MTESKKRMLPQAGASQMGLGTSTIMDRSLAAQYGVPFVHLAVFAIDIDRVFMETSDETELPFGWEVSLCLGYVLGHIDSTTDQGMGVLEDTCLHILSYAPGDAPLGSQLAFAVHLGARAGVLSDKLQGAFRAWKKRPRQLERAVDHFLSDPRQTLAPLADVCLRANLQPPLAPPTVQVLTAMAEGTFAMPLPARPDPDSR